MENNQELKTLLNQYHFHDRVYEKMEEFRIELDKDIPLEKIPSLEFLKNFNFPTFLSNFLTIHYTKYSNPKMDRPTLFVGDRLKVKFSLEKDPSIYHENEVIVQNPDSFLKAEYVKFLHKTKFKFPENFIHEKTILSIKLLDPSAIPLNESNSFFNCCLVNFLNHYFSVCVSQARLAHAQSKSQAYNDPEDPDRLMVNLFMQIIDEERPFSEHLELALNFFSQSKKQTAKYKKVKEVLEMVHSTKDCGYFLSNYAEIINSK